MSGKVSFLFSLFSGLGCGFVMFFLGVWVGYREGRDTRREDR